MTLMVAWLATGIVVVFFASAVPSLAAPPPVDVATLTLDEAIALAREQAAKVQDARAKVALAQLDVQATRWWQWLIPSVTAQPGYELLRTQQAVRLAELELLKAIGLPLTP
jgi:hypothetical protein